MERRLGLEPYHIYRQDPENSNAQPLTNEKLEEVLPRLSPDLRWILFAGRADSAEPWQLFRIPTEGGSPVIVNTDGPLAEFQCPAVGTQCLLRKAENHKEIAFYSLDPLGGIGRRVFQLPWRSNDLGDWSLSPDGREVALTVPQTTSASLQIGDMRTGRVTELAVAIPSRLRAINWAPDQSGWYVVAEPGLGNDIYFVDRRGKATLLQHTASTTFVIPKRDGRQVAFVGQKHELELHWLER